MCSKLSGSVLTGRIASAAMAMNILKVSTGTVGWDTVGRARLLGKITVCIDR